VIVIVIRSSRSTATSMSSIGVSSPGARGCGVHRALCHVVVVS
jgi:hypothetical protein